ncbi:MAG: tRNA (adenosine(37)-N6)-threonylcarbamoyltransferase complex dimerization subunit type 1 TsaB [Christensenellales bacterium]
MIGLVLDTSMDKAIIGLSVNGKREIYISEKPRHNAELLPAIDALMQRCGLKITDMDCFGAVVGPGSFTGIRVGVSTVNAFCYALGKRAASINALELLRKDKAEDILAMIDARHDNYYTALYKREGVEYAFLNREQIEKLTCKKILRTQSDPDALMDVFEEKMKKGELTAPVRPFYLRASSAETGV